MGGLIESLKRNRHQFLIAGIELQFTTKEDEQMYSRKELESKSIKELTDIHNKLVAKNDRKATFRDKEKALAAIEAAEKAAAKSEAAPAKGASKATAKAAEKAAGELKKNAEKVADNTVWTAKSGQFRFNEGSVRKQVYGVLLDAGKGMTTSQIQEALPKAKGIPGALQVLKSRSQVSASS
jgi:membrane protein involved in colicin uptake